MKVLKNINLKDIISVDIETVRLEENYEDLSEGYQSAWEYKNKQDGQIPDNLNELWTKNASLYAEFSKVCAVSLAFLNENGNKLSCMEFYGDDEFTILSSLNNVLDRIYNKSRNYRLVGHASKFFDYPFLAKRYIINGMDIPSILDVTALKPWEQPNLCTNELWKVGGTGAGSSLQALCNCLNIPVSKVDLVGDEVGKAFYNKEYARIGRYCSYDTVATFNVMCKLKKEPTLFEFSDVSYINGCNNKPVTVKQHPMQKIVDGDNSLTQEELNIVISKIDDGGKDAMPLLEIVENFMV